VEQYWTCYDGNPTRKDTCEETCGDGVDFLINACEDANVLEWDGCNRYCNMEEGWVCSGGTLTNPDTCVETAGDGCRVGTEE
jgi:cysteine-rich repeat protein